jgi:RNA polymerase I-specific transcription initiation factor RRN7
LQELVGFTFKYPEPESHDNRKISQYLPDVQLMVLIVIATKLLFPIDDLKRYPTSAKEPAVQVMDWPLWTRAQTRFDHDPRFGDNLGKGTAIHVTDKDVLNMTSAQMDNYMDWYASSWLDTSRASTRIAELFPISRTEPNAQPILTATPGSSSAPDAPNTTEEKLNTLLKTVMQNLKVRRVIPEDEEAEDRRPGEWYRRYRWESQLTGPARSFYEAAAQLAAVPLKSLVHAVSLVEFKIAKQDEERQNREFFARQGREGMDSDESDVDNTYGMDDFEEDIDEPEFEDMADDKMW